MIISLTLDQILCTKSIKAPQIIQTHILLIFFETLPHLLFSFQLVTENEIYEVIKCHNSKNSCGSDGISSKLIKYIIEELSMPLTVIINQIFTTGIFPDNLNTAKIHPLLKAGNPLPATNYRPISLLTSISKIFEKIIFNQLTNYLSLNNILTDSRYGFRKKSFHSISCFRINRQTDDFNG